MDNHVAKSQKTDPLEAKSNVFIQLLNDNAFSNFSMSRMKTILMMVLGYYFLITISNAQGRIDSLIQKANELVNTNPDSAEWYAREVLKLSEENKSTEELKKLSIYKILGSANIRKGDADSAMKYYSLNLELALGIDNKNEIADANKSIGTVHRLLGNYDDAISHNWKALRIYKDIDDSSRLASSWNSIGLVYQDQGYCDSAFHYYFKALHFAEVQRDSMQYANVCTNLGITYSNCEDNHVRALKYHFRTLEMSEKSGKKRVLGTVYNNIGGEYFLLDKKDTALMYFNKAIAIQEEIGNKKVIADILANIGQIHLSREEYHEALDNFHESLSLDKEMSNKKGIAMGYSDLGHVFIKLNNPQKAIAFLTKGKDIANLMPSPLVLAEIQLRLANAYSMLGNYKLAYTSQKEHSVLTDSLFGADMAKSLAEMSTKYETQMKQDSIKAAKEKITILEENELLNQAQIKQQSLINNSLAALAILLLLILYLLYTIQLRTKRGKENVERLQRGKHHEIKDALEHACIYASETLERIKDLRVFQRVEDLISRIRALELYHIAMYQQSEVTKIQLQPYLELLIAFLQKGYGKPDIVINIDADATLDHEIGYPLVRIINEVVVNALRHAFPERESGVINIQAIPNPDDGQLTVSISDDGIGYPDEFEPRNTQTYGTKLIHGVAVHELNAEAPQYSNLTEGGARFELRIKQ